MGRCPISGAGSMAFDGYEAPWMPYAEEITKIELGNGVTTLADYAFRLYQHPGDHDFPLR